MKNHKRPAAEKRPEHPIEAYSGDPRCRSCIQQVLDAIPASPLTRFDPPLLTKIDPPN